MKFLKDVRFSLDQEVELWEESSVKLKIWWLWESKHTLNFYFFNFVYVLHLFILLGFQLLLGYTFYVNLSL